MKNLITKILGLFKRLDNSEKEIAMSRIEISLEDFERIETIQAYLNENSKQATILNPRKVTNSKTERSYMGGSPNLSNFEKYPKCDSCESSLNFVLQLDKESYPEFYWPTNKTIFQLFRCPNYECPKASSLDFDLKMFHYYFENLTFKETNLTKPKNELADFEQEVNFCLFTKEKKTDYNDLYYYSSETYKALEKKYGEDIVEEFYEKHQPIQRTKIGGYPSFTQNEYYPTCECGITKSFFFQISSEDNDGVENSSDFSGEDFWSHHGIMIGDVGNIYYYICKKCGEKSIESYWDCC